MIDEIKVKVSYNEELKRWKKYESFCESNKNNLEAIEKWIPQAKEITNNLGQVLDEMKLKAIKYTESEVLHGFLV